MQTSLLRKSCALTGHCPARFSFGEDNDKCSMLKAILKEQIETLVNEGITDFYTGMALGVDQWAASIVLGLKKKNPFIRLVAVLAYEGQANDWNEEQRNIYFNILPLCDDVITLQTQYTPLCMHECNKYLVYHSDRLLAVYDGGQKGGTAYTVKYAKQKRLQITIINPNTMTVKL